MATVLKICAKHGEQPHYYYNSYKYYKCRVCNCENVKKRHKKVKALLVEYKGGKCEECGYSKCLSALQFHHKNSTTKSFGIAEKMYSKSLELLKQEVDKCELLCSNCHFEHHDGGSRPRKSP